MSSKKNRPYIIILLLATLLSSCIDDGKTPTSDVAPQTITVSVTPETTALPTGGTKKFTAVVQGSATTTDGEGNTAVIWSIEEGAVGGTITSTGDYTAPAISGTFHLVATSQADDGKSGTATVTVSSSLDISFNGTGSVSTGIGGIDVVNALATQSDGKILAAGSSLNGTETDFALARYNSDGSLDSTFGKNGIVVTSMGGSVEINALLLQPDGKIVVGGNTSNIVSSNFTTGSSDFVIARYQRDGGLDPTFGPNASGIVTTAIGLGADRLNALLLQADGAIVAGGFSFNVPAPATFINGENIFALVRYQSNGTLDAAFGTNGIVTTPFDANEIGEINALQLQPDGKIVAGGLASLGNNDNFALVRYETTGTLDTGFGSAGITKTPIGSGDEHITALLLQPDGKIIAGGPSQDVVDTDFALARYDASGGLDPSFDGDGKLRTEIGLNSVDGLHALLLQSDGKIVAGGFSSNGTNNDFALLRYDAVGTPDPSFDTDGIVTTPVGTGNDAIFALALQSDGKIIAGGFASDGTRSDFSLLRYSSTGGLDSSFSGDGKLRTAIGGGSDEINAVAIQSDGKIVVAGFSYGIDRVSNHDFSLARYETTGTLDTTFGAAGRITTPLGGSRGEEHDKIQAIAIQSDGKIIVGGLSFDRSTSTSNDFALARYNTDGGLDLSFGGTGTVKTSVDTVNSGVNEEINALVLQGDGKIIAAGTSFTLETAPTLSHHDFILLRYNADGTVDSSFDTDGIVKTQIGTDGSFAEAAAMQSDGKILLAGMSSNGTDFDVTLARYNTNGSLDLTFDSDGIATTAVGAGNDSATAIKLQSDGKIVVAANPFTGDTVEQFSIIRYNSDGSLDTLFGTNGIVTTPIAGGSRPFALAIQSDGKIVAGGFAFSALNNRDFALVRYNTDGTLDTSFGSEGIEITPFSAEMDEIHDLVIATDGKIIAVGFSTQGNGRNTDFQIARYIP